LPCLSCLATSGVRFFFDNAVGYMCN
jgi:hypothetical protein